MADNMIGGNASLLDTSSTLSALEASAPGYVPNQLAPEQFQSKQLSDIIEAKQQQRKEALAAKEVKDNSSYVERLTAAAKGTDTYLLGKYLFDPAEIPVAGYNSMEDIKALQFPVSPDDINYLSKARSPEGFSERTKALLAQRENQDLASASPALNFLVQAVDPVYLLADAVSLGAGHAMKASRIATGVLAAAGAATVSAAATEVRPVSDEEIILNTLLNGAASMAVYKPPKMRTETGGDVKPVAENKPSPDKGAPEDTPATAGEDTSVVPPKAEPAPTNTEVVPPKAEATPQPEVVKETPVEPVVESVPVQAKEAMEGAVQAVKAHADAAEIIKRADEIAPSQLEIALTRDADGLVQYPAREKGFLASADEAAVIKQHVLNKPLPDAARALVDLAPTKGMRVVADAVANRIQAMRDFGVSLGTVKAGDSKLKAKGYLGYTDMNKVGDYPSIEVNLIDQSYPTALHEITHAATMHAVSIAKKENTKEYVQAVTLLTRLRGRMAEGRAKFDRAPQNMRSRHFSPEESFLYSTTINALDNVDEMITWGMTNTAFQKWLSGIKLSSNQTLWSKFVNTVADFLGVPREAHTALQEVLSTAEHFLSTTAEVTATRGGITRALNISLNAVSKTSTGRYRLEWSLYKSLSSLSDKAGEWASKLLADPIQQTSSNAASIYRTLYADHTVKLEQAEKLTVLALSKQGWGVIRRMRDPKGYRTAQLSLHNKVMREMEGRNASGATRITSDNTVAALADRYAEYGQYVAKRLEDFGMAEPGFADNNKNYVPRRMQVGRLQELESAMGKTTVRDQLAASVLKANPTMTLDTAKAVAYAMIERAKSKVNLTEQPNVHVDSTSRDTLKGMLSRSGLPQEDIDKAISILGTESNDAGKAPMLKYRVKLDYSMPLGTGSQTIGDLFSHDLTTLYESYNRRISGHMSMWKVGLQRQTDIDKAWKEIAESIPDPVHKADAKQLFDGTINYLLGNPVGEAVPEAMRTAAGMTQAVALGSSPFWQTLDYFKIMAQHGAMDTLGAALRSLPEARTLWKEMKAATKEGRQVALDMDEVLTAQIASDIRMRPILDVYEDGFSVGKSPWAQRAETARDATPFLSGQKYLHFHQAKTIASLSVQTVRKAANGDAKAIQAMRRYGVSGAQLQSFKQQFDKFGTAPDKWDRGVWLEMNTALLRMADDSVLRMQLGEIPAFAQFSSLGKFLFTFRSFTLAAQNKVLLSTLKNDGAAGVAMLLAYQYPMSCLAVAANMAINNDPNISQKTVVERAFGYVPVLGLGSELVGILNGSQRGFGSPGLLYIDKAYRAIGQAAQLDGKGLASTTVSMLPFVSVIPGSRALQNALKEESK